MSQTLTAGSTSSGRLDELDSVPDSVDPGQMLDDRRALDRMMTLIHRWDPIDRQVTLLYLEGMDAASIGEIAGISPGNVATKIHRVKKTHDAFLLVVVASRRRTRHFRVRRVGRLLLFLGQRTTARRRFTLKLQRVVRVVDLLLSRL